VALEPVAPAESTGAPPTAAAPMPPLPVAQVAEAGRGVRRIQRLDAIDQDVRVVVQGLAESFGLGYRLAPEVSGRVTARLQDVTLEEALETLLGPLGFTYAVQDGVLRVGPVRHQTRIFGLDFISLARIGQATTVVQRRLGLIGPQQGLVPGAAGVVPAVPGIAGVQNAVAGGADVITSVSVADLWDEIRVALDGIVFAGESAAERAAPAAQPYGGAARAPGAYSRSGEDGRRLILNPVAGTVLVTAPAETLAEVEAYIAAFEGSVQRQVLIEAKIVEVLLDREYEFGIDWRSIQALQLLNDVQLKVNPRSSGFEFTLTRPTTTGQPPLSTAEQVNVVLDALESQGDVRVLSSPRTAAMNNQRAIFNVTTDEVFFAVTQERVIGPDGTTIGFAPNIQAQQIAVGIVLDVLPQIGANNTVTMNVRPVVTNVVRVEEITLEDGTTARAPVIDRRESDTVVRARAGETIVIGGLMQTRHERERVGLPLLKDLPVIGALFGTTRDREVKGELVIFLTPTIVAGQPAPDR